MTQTDELPPPPEVVHDLAEACTRFVQESIGVDLDYTQDTLPLLDHYLGIASDSDDDVLALVIPAAGAYFGEVARRHVGTGRWVDFGSKYEDWRLEFDPGPLSLNPVGIVFECAISGSADGWGAEFQVPPKYRDEVREAVAVLGDVREEDYYTLAVRLEVLQLVHENLVRFANSARLVRAAGDGDDDASKPN